MARVFGLSLIFFTAAACNDSTSSPVDSRPSDGASVDASPIVDTDLGEESSAVDDASTDAVPKHDAAYVQNPFITARPYQSHVPTHYDANQPTPLLVMLHGYASNAAGHEAYFHLTELSDKHGFLYAYPDGTTDIFFQQFWNATDACCDIFKKNVDDVKYINAVLDDMQARYSVDAKRIFLVGHSNGGFLSYRMACDAALRIAAIVSLDGDNWKDISRCRPQEPVAILQIHGDMDGTVNYKGGNFPNLALYPSAHDSIMSWVTLNRCSTTVDTSTAAVDISADLAGNETTIERWNSCHGGAAELWTVHSGVHQPTLAAGATELMWNFLAAHAKP